VLGLIPGQPQPSQKRFDTLVWQKLRGFDAQRPVYVESESRKVGNLAVAEPLIQAMRASPCLRIDLPDDERVQLLLEDYAFFSRDPELFCERLDALVQLRGREQVQAWQQQVRAGAIEPIVRELLLKHYDPGYAGSTQRNFRQFGEARVLVPRDRTAQAMAEVARELVRS
jgi:tRNA 2-selenouridine synthase